MLSPRRILQAAHYSMRGFKSAFQTEAAFRDNLMLVVAIQALTLWLRPELTVYLLVILVNALLLLAELLNTGLEYLADHISLEQHDLLGRAKDVGSAAVFVMLMMNALMVGVLLWSAFGGRA